MKKVEIGGQEFTLRNEDEVTWGADRLVQHEKNVAELAMLSNADIVKYIEARKSGADGVSEGLSNEEALVMLDDIKESLIAAQDGAFPSEEEKIMLSVNLSRAEIGELPKKIVMELAIAADKELGGLQNFTKTSTTDST